MNQDKKMRLLLLPLTFIVLLHVPAIIVDITPNEFIQKMPGGIFWLIPCIAMLIWSIFFYYISTGAYIAMLAVYTIVSWRWILRQKKGNAIYFIVWLVLCVLSILMYWRWGPEYYYMISG